MLKVLPTLIAGEPTVLTHQRSPTTITPSPPAAVPPILVGGHSDAAIQRAVTYADGWFPSLMPPHTLAARVRTLRARAASQARPEPIVHFGTHVMLGSDSAARRAELVRELVDSFAMSTREAGATTPARSDQVPTLAADHRVIFVGQRGRWRSTPTASPYGAKILTDDARKKMLTLLTATKDIDISEAAVLAKLVLS